MSVRNLILDETGAVTVDWVVVAAASIGIGLSVMAFASGGVERVSVDIADTLREQVATVVEAATAGLTATSVWDNPAVSSRDLSNTERFSFLTVVTFSADDEGIIFETGGGVYGTVLYQHDGVLYLQAGRGNGVGATADRGEASWQVVDGTATIEGSLDADGGLALIVNGQTVSQSSFAAPRLAGGNAGSVGGTNTGVAVNRGGFNRNSAGHPGVTAVTLFEGQTTGDEQAPVN